MAADQSAITAKKNLYILEETKFDQKSEDTCELINLYTKLIKTPSHALQRKILNDKLDPLNFW